MGKQEKSDGEILDMRVADFEERPGLAYKHLVDMLVEGKEVKVAMAAKDPEMLGSFFDMLDKHIRELEKAKAAIDKVMSGTKMKAGAVQKLLLHLDCMDEKQEKVVDFADRHGVQVKASKAKPGAKRRRGSQAS